MNLHIFLMNGIYFFNLNSYKMSPEEPRETKVVGELPQTLSYNPSEFDEVWSLEVRVMYPKI